MKRIQVLITFVLALAMLAGLARPVLAEPPPPPADGGAPPVFKAPVNALPDQEADDAQDAAVAILPPQRAPDAVAAATAALYQADGMLVDGAGNPVALASELAHALMLPAKEVRGCPPGVMPVNMGGTGVGCTNPYTVINAAITDPKVVSGWTVWVMVSTNYNEAVTINKAVNVAGEFLKTDHRVPTIGNHVTFTTGNASLRDFTVNGQVFANGTAGKLTLTNLRINAPGMSGVDIRDHNGAVTLMNVLSQSNLRGAGVHTLSALPVNIINSAFDSSSGDFGLAISSLGAVRIENVSINDVAGGDGLYLDAFGPQLTIKNSTFMNSRDGTAANGLGFGIRMRDAATGGKVVIDNTYVGNNQEGGALFTTIGDLLVSNSNFSVNNTAGGVGGLLVVSGKGNASISNSYFSGNNNFGLFIMSVGQGAFSLTNTALDGNTLYGLAMLVGGNVTLKGVRARQNLGAASAGARIENFSRALAARTVTVQESIFSNNSGNGLWIESRGAVSMNHINAEANTGGSGIRVDNCWLDAGKCRSIAPVTLSNTLGPNRADGNQTNGIEILSGGTVSLTGLSAGGNLTGMGLALQNLPGVGSVILKQVHFTHNQTHGAVIVTKGAVTITQSSANFNHTGGSGIIINNASGLAKPVTLNGFEAINSRDYAIQINASGAITLKNVSVELTSQEYGILLDNSTGSGGVTLGNVSVLGSKKAGLAVNTRGNVSINGLKANNNQGGGIVISTLGSTTPRTVTLYNVEAYNNANFGLNAYTRGSFLLNHVWVWNNNVGATYAGYGAVLNNCVDPGSGCTGSGSVTINDSYGENWFHGNDDYGLQIISKGAVALNNVHAGWNNVTGAYGTRVDNSQGTAPVTINRSLFEANQGRGLEVISRGAITLRNVIASENISEYGALLDNSGAAGAPGVIVYNSDFIHNLTYGLQVKSKGGITINNITASQNVKEKGVILNNSFGSGSVTISSTLGSNVMSLNGTTGLSILSKGSISMNGALLEQNGQFAPAAGIDIINIAGTGSVTLSNIFSNANKNSSGVYIQSSGRVALDKMVVASNGSFGILVDNSFSTTFQPVTLTNIVADGNDLNGVTVTSDGLVTLNHVGASYNKVYGVYIFNGTGTAGVNILGTLGPNKMVGNTDLGLFVTSKGNIAVNNARISENGLGVAGEGASGARLNTSGTSSITLTCSLISGNAKHGIEATLGSGALKLVGSFAFNNDKKGVLTYADVNIPYSFIANACGY